MVGFAQIAVLGILIQQREVHGRVGQALAVVLAVDGQQPGADVPHHRGGGGHAIDAAAALALGIDFAVKQQVVQGLVAAALQFGADRFGDILEGGPDTGFLRAAAHQLAGGAVAQDRVDGVDQDGLARAGLAGQHIKAGGKFDLGFFDHGNIFDFEVRQHAVSPPLFRECVSGAACSCAVLRRWRGRLPRCASG